MVKAHPEGPGLDGLGMGGIANQRWQIKDLKNSLKTHQRGHHIHPHI